MTLKILSVIITLFSLLPTVRADQCTIGIDCFSIQRPKVKYQSIFNSTIGDITVEKTTITEFRAGPTEFDLPYKINTGPTGAGHWTLNISEAELHELIKSKGHNKVIEKITIDRDKRNLIRYTLEDYWTRKYVEKGLEALFSVLDLIDPTKIIGIFSALNDINKWIDYDKKIPLSAIEQLIAEGGEIIKSASIITVGSSISVNQEVIYKVNIGEEQRIIPIRRAKTPLRCDDADNCVDVLGLPIITILEEYVTNQDTFKWELYNVEVAEIDSYEITIDYFDGKQTVTVIYPPNDYITMSCNGGNCDMLKWSNITATAYKNESPITSSNSLILTKHCDIELSHEIAPPSTINTPTLIN